MKLTNQEVYDYMMLKLDKHSSPYFDEAWVTKFFNESYAEWIALVAVESELTEKRRFDLHSLVVRANPPAGKVVNIGVLTPAPYRLLAVYCDYNFTCKGKTTARTRPVKPMKWDSFSVSFDDPYNRPTNQFPAYSQITDSNQRLIEILSKDAPIRTSIVYIKEPVWIDIEGNPNGTIEVEYPQQLEIIDICLRKLFQTIESQFGLTAQTQIEIPNNE